MAPPEFTTQYEEDRKRIAERIPRMWGKSVQIGDGWMPIVIELDRKLAEINPDYELHQVKEKFGGLRYYTDFLWSEGDLASELIRAAEEESFRTCERCGEPGTTDADGGWWILTLCDEHHAERLAEKERDAKP